MTKFLKGESGNPSGRPKGSPNKATKEIREAYKELIENNLSNLSVWLERVANDNPEKALYFIAKLSEFVEPKLQATEITNKSILETMTESELNILIDKLKKDYGNH